MSEGIGLEAGEIRAARISIGVSMMVVGIGFTAAGAVVGPHWVLFSYAAGMTLAWVVLRADRAGGPARRLRRALGRVCGWELRLVLLPVIIVPGIWVLAEFLVVPLDALKGLWDPEMTKAEISGAIEEAVRRIPARTAPWIAVIGVSGIAAAFLSGLTDRLLLGAVGARHGVSAWRVLPFGRARRDWREEGLRERTRRRDLLRGEG